MNANSLDYSYHACSMENKMLEAMVHASSIFERKSSLTRLLEGSMLN